MSVVVSHKHHATRRRHGARPHPSPSRHRILPGAFGGFRVDGAQDDLPSFFSRSASREVLHWLRLLRRTAEHAALLKRNHVEKPGARMITLTHPVGSAFHAWAHPITFRSRI